ncbi:MAG: gamma-glutamyl-gamma-aminobutyrate hydrolase family protein [Anaerolineae bacterium]
MRQPLIGITTAILLNERAGAGAEFYSAYTANARAVERAGGLPILIPCDLSDESLRALYDRVDAILLPGGGDIDPAAYRAERNPNTGKSDARRDHAEITIAQWAAAEQTPLFAICRGHQVVNVALGGTLIQDIPTQIESPYDHYYTPDQQRHAIAHTVNVESGSWLATIAQTTQLHVNSLHHQAMEQVAPGLRVTAYAPDGIIEAAELPGHPFFHSVQWHPEDLTAAAPMQALFDALVEAARQRISS